MSDDEDGYVESAAASDAFKLLGNETRVSILQALLARDEAGHVKPAPRTFSELYEATDEETTAGFAYHLRQLVGHYLSKDEETETYSLTYAGLQAARGVTAGTYTQSVDREPVPLEEPCPLCGEFGLDLGVSDNVGWVSCSACDGDVLSLPFPPGGIRSHDAETLPGAFDSHHRHRISLMADGNCPDCGGVVTRVVELVGATNADVSAGEDEPAHPVQAALDCGTCGCSIRCPVTLTLLDEPEVVAFYRDHGEALEDRPIWNVGSEWSERVLSEDPLAVRVRSELDEESLSLFVSRDLCVVHEERWNQQQDDGARDGQQRGNEEGTADTEMTNTGSDSETDSAAV